MYDFQPALTLGDLRRALAEAKDFPDDLPIRANKGTALVRDFGIMSPPNHEGWFNIVVE